MTIVQGDPLALDNIIIDVTNKFSDQITQCWLLVSTKEQRLYLINSGVVECRYSISTSKYGVGEEQDSYKTPRGAHVIERKIGDDCALNEILRARQPTQERAEIISHAECSQQDLVLTRILWLKGLEPGKNLGDGVDSFQRYIYIHGTQEEGLIGTAASHGCVRMLNKDVIELYDRIAEGTFVYID